MMSDKRHYHDHENLIQSDSPNSLHFVIMKAGEDLVVPSKPLSCSNPWPFDPTVCCLYPLKRYGDFMFWALLSFSAFTFRRPTTWKSCPNVVSWVTLHNTVSYFSASCLSKLREIKWKKGTYEELISEIATIA